MSEYTKGYWVKHKKLVKKWDEYEELQKYIYGK